MLMHPEVASRSCEECQRVLFDDRPGEFATKPVERGRKVVLRVVGQRPPCSFCPKQPEDVPDRDRAPATAVELSEASWQAYHHYLECRATGQFPNDPIVKRNAAIIRAAEDAAADMKAVRLAALSRRQ